MLKIKSKELELIADRFKVESVSYTVEGENTEYKRHVVRHPGAVVILALDNDNTIFMVNQPRLALEADSLELPAGTLNLGEDPLVCAKRELSEEIGQAASSWISLGYIHPAPGFCDEKIYVFVASGLSSYESPPDPDERIERRSYDLKTIETKIAEGEIKDSKTLATLLKAKLAGILR